MKEGDIRLVHGSYLWQGRVEIFLSGVWGTTNVNAGYNKDAKVICRQLGYTTYCESIFKRFVYNSYFTHVRIHDIIVQTYGCCARFGEGSGPIHLTHVSCTGLEHRLTDCEYSNNTEDDSHSKDFSVFCYIGQYIIISSDILWVMTKVFVT